MEKSIYMKTEPGGGIGFCELNESQIKLLEDTFKEKDLKEILNILFTYKIKNPIISQVSLLIP